MDHTFYLSKIGSTAVIGLMVLAIPMAIDARTEVVNTVEVRSSTGGNTGGQIQEGESVNSMFIRTTVDGEEVMRFEEASNESIQFNESYQSSTNNANIEVNASASTNDSAIEMQRSSEIRKQRPAQTLSATTTTEGEGDRPDGGVARGESRLVSLLEPFGELFSSFRSFMSSFFAYVFDRN